MAKMRTWAQYDDVGKICATLRARSRPKGKGWREIKVPTITVRPASGQRRISTVMVSRIKGRWRDL